MTRRPGATDLDIHIWYPGEGDADDRANNRIANLILAGAAIGFLGLVAAFVAGAWS